MKDQKRAKTNLTGGDIPNQYTDDASKADKTPRKKKKDVYGAADGGVSEGPNNEQRPDRGNPRRLRQTITYKLISDMVKTDMVSKIVDMHGISDGTVALIRTEDGDAYEVVVKPSYMGDYFQDKRGVE